MHLLVHGVGDRVGQPGQGAELFERRLLHRLDAAELLDQALASGRAEAGDVVEHRLRHPLAPQLAVVRDGEAVGLVADPLQQVERLGVARDADRLGDARHVHLFEPLGQDGDRDLLSSPSSSSTSTATPSWPLPPSTSSRCGGYANRPPRSATGFVALDEVGGEPAGEHLLHRREVVVARHAP